MTKKRIIIAILLIIVIVVGVLFFLPKKGGEQSSKWITSTVTSENIVQSITATGTVEPVTEVEVGTQVSGILTTLYVDYNSVVKKGQIIAELDKSTLILEYNSSQNDVAIAKSKYEYELANYTRVKTLHEKQFIADSEYEESLYNYETAKNNYEVSKNNLMRAETNLGYATIYSPIDGVVLSRSVEEGQTVASSFSTPTLFVIAADLRDMRVIVDVDEADIGNVEVGQKAKFSVDAFPLDIFEGEVTQVRQEAIIESNVVTYEVVISADNPDLKLKPGLTANVEVFILDVECETVVPASALTFTPPKPADAPANMPNDMPADRGMDGGKAVWVLDGDRITPRRVTIGVTNGILTEVTGVELGAAVVTGMDMSVPMGAGAPPSGTSSSDNPFLPKRPGQK
ncbi:MAG: efflux RND transporter periplasmic adaptor subunit [Bacteroidales bacterium]